MPPKKLINRSRPVGSRKPPKATKTEPAPIPTDWASSTTNTDWDASTSGSLGNRTQTQASALGQPKPYGGLSQVSHGLKLPVFDPNAYFSADLFSDSSALPRTTKEKADELVQSIEEKRQTVRVTTANLGLNQDVVRAGNEYLKLEGLAIDYATTGVNNESKFINYQTAEINRDLAGNRFQQAHERLNQGNAVLNGMRSLTPLITQEWEARKSLKQSQISSLKLEATKAREALEPKLLQLSESFRQEVEDVA